MPLFKAKKADQPEPEQEPPAPTVGQGPTKKGHATPSRREAEAARRQRLNPDLSKREIKARGRQVRAVENRRRYAEIDNTPERQLMRDIVDSRFNLAEIAMPLLLVLMASTFLPGALRYSMYVFWAMWAFMAMIFIDTWMVWRRFKELAAQRIPHRPRKGLVMYAFNRQLSFRRWRTPPPRVNRGEKI